MHLSSPSSQRCLAGQTPESTLLERLRAWMVFQILWLNFKSTMRNCPRMSSRPSKVRRNCNHKSNLWAVSSEQSSPLLRRSNSSSRPSLPVAMAIRGRLGMNWRERTLLVISSTMLWQHLPTWSHMQMGTKGCSTFPLSRMISAQRYQG